MKTFDEQIRELQDERHSNEWWSGQRRLAKGEDIWVRFVAWCYGEEHGNTASGRATRNDLPNT